MPFSKGVARFNRRVTNRILGRVAGWLPGFAIVAHVGRRSGQIYRTPVNAFRRRGGYRVALTYGPEADWVKNVLAAGGCTLHTRGRAVRLVAPRLGHDPEARWAPPPVRLILGGVEVPDYLDLTLPEGVAGQADSAV